MRNNPKEGNVEIIKGGKFKHIITRQEIEQKYLQLAGRIKDHFSDVTTPVIIRIIPEGHYSFVDITRALSIVNQDFEADVIITTNEPGKNPIVQFPSKLIAHRHIIVLQNIVATGKTLELARNILLAYQPASISFFALGWKMNESKIDFLINYLGFPLDPGYYIGEGGGNYDSDKSLPGLWKKID